MQPNRSRLFPGAFRARLHLLLLSLAVATSAPGQGPSDVSAPGAIEGRVSNQATQSNLAGVEVVLPDLPRETVTSRDGSFFVPGLAPGSHRVQFRYPGLDPVEHTVEVPAAATARLDVTLTSQVYVMEAFVVASEREGNAAAIAAQRAAVAPTNIVASDAFGNIARGNVGNFLRRIPGITGTTDEADTDNVQLRGMSSAFTAIDIDGVKYATANGGRGQSVQGIPTDMIERIEVVKSPTPDMDSDSLGGRINMVTKSAYDRAGRQITLRAANTYSFTYGKDVGHGRDSWLSPNLAASYSDVFSVNGGHRNLGVMVTANWERILDVRGTTSWDSFSTVGGRALPQFNNVSVALHGIERGGSLAKVDYRFSDTFAFGGQVSFNASTNSLLRARNQLQSGAIRAISPGLTATVVDGAQYAVERSTRDNEENRTSARLWARLDDREAGLLVAGEATFQRTRGRNHSDQISARSNRRIDYVLDRRTETGSDMRWPALRVFRDKYTGTASNTAVLPTAFLDVNPFGDDLSNVGSMAGQWQQIYAKRELVTGRLDATKRLATRFPIEFKTGVMFEYEGFKQSRNDLRGGLNLAASGFGPDLRSLLDPEWDLGGAIGRYPVGFMLDLAKVRNAAGISFKENNADPALQWNFDPAKFTLNTSSTRQNTLQNTRRIWERSGAAYAMTTLDFDKLDVIAGVRAERTEVMRNQVIRDRSPGVTGTLAEWTTRQYSGTDYQKTYPSIHARYVLRPNLHLRVSYGMTSGKPDYGRILGVTDINETAREISIPNVNLRPRRSWNFDAGLSYYFEPVGELSVGVFQKDITDYDSEVSRDISPEEAATYGATPLPGDTTPWELTTRLNTGDGLIRGIELNYTQQFSNLLPGAWRGLGFYANFTYLKIEGTFDINEVGVPPVQVRQLDDVIPRTGNAGLSYSHGRYEARVSWNYNDHMPEGSGFNPATIKIRGQRWTMDASLKYRASRNFTFFADFVNITSNHGKKFRGFPDPELRNETNALGFLVTAGVSSTF
ncbi:MAG TPA: TonB-dependent receptor [Opitutaceae bacterium]|nr:TonB-dependent receptor [Opitutaceae bacterium]